jgi:Bor protein
MRDIALVLLLLALSGCYRTHYENFSPANPLRAPQQSFEPHRSEWVHFFIWGWVPDERFIDARDACGTAANVQAVETQRTFLEGLVAALAGYYINIYSPWNGRILCKEDPQSLLSKGSTAP